MALDVSVAGGIRKHDFDVFFGSFCFLRISCWKLNIFAVSSGYLASGYVYV